MSVLIKDMEIPKDGVYWCEIGVSGEIATITIHGEDHKSFHLVPVPPHGRLIDAEDDAIENLPSAQKAGRWERHYTRPNVFAYWRCSSCGRKAKNKYAVWFYKYCPHCGARMESDRHG